MNAKRIPAETFPVGELIQEELDERGWSHADLAGRTGLSPSEVSSIINGTNGMRAMDAEAIGRAFGTGPEMWLTLQRMGRKR
jgi:plasmid maintenance system antidote protein VapI